MRSLIILFYQMFMKLTLVLIRIMAEQFITKMGVLK